jgi:tetratricopeptide (TPR) repeat protein
VERAKPWHYRSGNAALLYICMVGCCMLGCGSPNHGALSDKALADAHAAFEKQNYKQAMQQLKVAAKEADLSDEAVHKNRVLREQIAVALAANDPLQAEEFARELVKFEQRQEFVEQSLTWHMQWAEDMVRADMLLGDTLRAQNRIKEALESYKAAVDKAKDASAPMALEASVSEHYVQASKELGGKDKSSATGDSAAAEDALETYNDLRDEMYNYRSNKLWDKLSEAAEKCAESGIRCKQYYGAVAAYDAGTLAEYMLGHTRKTRDLANKTVSLVKQHPEDKPAAESSANAWFFLAITDDSPTQAKKDALTAYTMGWGHADGCRTKTLEYLDEVRWNKVHDWWSELRIYGMQHQARYPRCQLWTSWASDLAIHKRLDEGCVWADRMYARKAMDMQDMADCDDALSECVQMDKSRRSRRLEKAISFREELRRQSPGDQFNLAHLASEYEQVGLVDKARELAQTTQRGINKNDRMYSLLDLVIKRCTNDQNENIRQ